MEVGGGRKRQVEAGGGSRVDATLQPQALKTITGNKQLKIFEECKEMEI